MTPIHFETAKAETTETYERKRSGVSRVVGYEILQASRDSAMLRTPEGRVARVSRGSRIAGLGVVTAIEPRGRGWVIKTEAGLID
jgi:hypothetical protein